MDKIFNKTADLIVSKRRDDRCAMAEALRYVPPDVVFAAAFPDAKVPRRMDSVITRIKTKHHFAKRNDIPRAFGFWFEG
jgi:hypothetical protein